MISKDTKGFRWDLKASLSGNEQLKKTIRIFPHKMEGEGHFIALLKKEEEAVSENLKGKRKKQSK